MEVQKHDFQFVLRFTKKKKKYVQCEWNPSLLKINIQIIFRFKISGFTFKESVLGSKIKTFTFFATVAWSNLLLVF